jgi:Uma2 family endonuclease
MRRKQRLYELVDGTLVEKPMGLSESMIAAQILRKIGNFAEEHDLDLPSGKAGTMRLLKALVRAPDVAFLCWDKLPDRMLPSKPMPDVAPDLAVDVLSQSNTPQEMQRELREYSLAGVRLVWVIDPLGRQAEVHTWLEAPAATFGEGQVLDGGDVLPGFTLPLAQLFARRRAASRRKGSPRKKKH